MKRLLRRLYDWLWFHCRLRGSEFHPSLDFDTERYWRMSPEQRQRYLEMLFARRIRAHEMDMEEEQ
jgi:hypothetical protein